MGCKINCSNPPILCQFSSRKPSYKISIPAFSSYNPSQENPMYSTTTTPTRLPKTDAYTISFKTLGACKLGISRYPDFEYNAQGGAGTGTGTKNNTDGNLNEEISVSFDLKTLYIPPLTSRTTKFLGLPLPPFLKIEIVPELFQGSINQETGQVKELYSLIDSG